MTRTIAALLAAATIAGVVAPAAAQTRYFAREKITVLNASAAGQPTTVETKCGALQIGYWNVDSKGSVVASSTMGQNAASAWCNTKKTADFSGICLWNANTAYLVIGTLGPAAGLYGSQCK